LGEGSPGGAFAVRRIPVESTRPLRRAVLRPHQSLAEVAASEPAEAVAFGAFEGDALVAVGLVGPEGRDGEEGVEESWRIRGMATEQAARGRGAGRAILAALVAYATEQGAQRIWCQARVDARGLYGAQGFRAVSEVFELSQIGPHLTMERRVRPDP